MIASKLLRKVLIILAIVLFASWLIILPVRSVVHAIRVYKEFNFPVEGYLDNISACKADSILDSEEKIRYYKYLSLGEECEK